MSARRKPDPEPDPEPEEIPDETVNEVRLVGRLSQPPAVRTLPSGDPLWTFRVVVPRTASRAGGPEGGPNGRSQVDALECAVWGGRSRRTVAAWRAGDLVEVTGAVRRRFYRAGNGPVSRVEIEVSRARLVRRRANA